MKLSLINDDEKRELPFDGPIVLVEEGERHTHRIGESEIDYRRMSIGTCQSLLADQGGADPDEAERTILAGALLGWRGLQGDPPFSEENALRLPANAVNEMREEWSRNAPPDFDSRGKAAISYRRVPRDERRRAARRNLRKGRLDLYGVYADLIGYMVLGWSNVYRADGSEAPATMENLKRLPLNAAHQLLEAGEEISGPSEEKQSREAEELKN